MSREPAPKKSLGQHFLTEKSVSQRIAAFAAGFDCGAVLEIGPGRGALTEYLAQSGKPLYCVEADPDMARILRERFAGTPGLYIYEADFLKWEPEPLAGQKALCAGNLPYYITTPIIRRFIELKDLFVCGVFMVQREVADRLPAQPGTRECGAFGLYCRYYCETSRVMNVSRGCFFPVPKVDSSVICMTLRGKPPVEAVTPYSLTKTGFLRSSGPPTARGARPSLTACRIRSFCGGAERRRSGYSGNAASTRHGEARPLLWKNLPCWQTPQGT